MNFQTHCECSAAGFCKRHGIEKSPRKHEICRGLNCDLALHAQFWEAWENGRQPGQSAPVAAPKAFEPPRPAARAPARGLGDQISSAITWATGGGIKPCRGCQKRAATLNHWFPANLPPIEPVALDNPVRHLMFHLWPVAGFGAWQWNCDRLLENAALFNGRRIVAIADGPGPETDSADAVREYLKNFTDEFVIIRNSPKLREVAAFIPMLERLEKYQGNQDVTFSCHGKCVRHKLTRDESYAKGNTIFHWTASMWETCLHWPTVAPLLERHGAAGSFRRFNANGGFFSGFGPWHYSGSFYWFRNRDAFRRNWRYVPQRFYGTEAWPGLMFKPDEAAVIVGDNVGDLYVAAQWEDLNRQLDAWRSSR